MVAKRIIKNYKNIIDFFTRSKVVFAEALHEQYAGILIELITNALNYGGGEVLIDILEAEDDLVEIQIFNFESTFLDAFLKRDKKQSSLLKKFFIGKLRRFNQDFQSIVEALFYNHTTEEYGLYSLTNDIIALKGTIEICSGVCELIIDELLPGFYDVSEVYVNHLRRKTHQINYTPGVITLILKKGFSNE